MVKISTLSGVAAAALLIGVVGATAQSSRDSGAGNTQPPGGGASSAQGSGGSLGAGAGTSGGGSAGTSAQTGQPRSGAGAGTSGSSNTSGAANTQPPGGGASSAQGANGSLGESGKAGASSNATSSQGSSNTRTGSSESSSSGGAVTLSNEEQTKLKSSIKNVSVKQTNINVDVRTGTVLPETVITQLEPIPAQIVEIVPRFKGYRVIRVKNEILIVEPSSRRVVYIIQS
jgi:hypothetical protein